MISQAIHIFLKDARRLVWPVAISLILLAVAAWRDSPAIGPNRPPALALTSFTALAFLSWWCLTVLLIHGEPLVGDREFWLTRPYRRASLVAAKSLFLLGFIHLPVLLYDIVILLRHGYAPTDFVTPLIAHQFGVAFVVLPFVALACTTGTLIQATLFALGAAALVMVSLNLATQYLLGGILAREIDAFQWVKSLLLDGIVFAAVVAIVGLQLVFRRVVLCRILIVLALFAVVCVANLIPIEAGFKMSSALRAPTAAEQRIQIVNTPTEIDLDQWQKPRSLNGETTFRKILDVANAASNRNIRDEYVRVELVGSGYTYYVGPGRFVSRSGKGMLMFTTYIANLEAHMENPVRLRATLYLTVSEERELNRRTLDATSIRAGAAVPCFDLSLHPIQVRPRFTAPMCSSPFDEYSMGLRLVAGQTRPDVVVSHSRRGALPSWVALSPMGATAVGLREKDLDGGSSLVLVESIRKADIKRTIDIEVPRLADLAQ